MSVESREARVHYGGFRHVCDTQGCRVRTQWCATENAADAMGFGALWVGHPGGLSFCGTCTRGVRQLLARRAERRATLGT